MTTPIFEHGQSLINTADVLSQIDGACECQPYQDVFTYHGWKAQGYHVRKGESSHIKVCVFQTSEIKDDNGKVVKTKSWPKQSCLFCRCQVEKNEEKVS